MSDEWFKIALIVAFCAVAFLLTQRWVWAIIFFLCTAASFFSMIASVIYFQIVAALGFMILMFICVAILMAIVAND